MPMNESGLFLPPDLSYATSGDLVRMLGELIESGTKTDVANAKRVNDELRKRNGYRSKPSTNAIDEAATRINSSIYNVPEELARDVAAALRMIAARIEKLESKGA